METWYLFLDRGLLCREARTQEDPAAVGREAGGRRVTRGPWTLVLAGRLCCGSGGDSSGTKTHVGGREGASQGSDFGASWVTWREGRAHWRTSLLSV